MTEFNGVWAFALYDGTTHGFMVTGTRMVEPELCPLGAAKNRVDGEESAFSR